MSVFSQRTPRHLVDARQAYALWAPSYAPWAHNPLMRAEQTAVEELVTDVTLSDALDVGTGTGRYVPVLERRGARRIVGIDWSMEMLAGAETRPRSALVCADANALPFRRDSFDFVLASLMVGDVEHVGGWAAEMARVLRPGGHLLFSDFHETWAARGWKRTIRTNNRRTLVVPYWPHLLVDHLRALDDAGLSVREIRNVRLPDDTDPAVRAFRNRWGDAPVAVVILASRAR